MKQGLQNEGIGIDDTRTLQATLQARAYLQQAITRLHELSDSDRQRLTYLEQRSLDGKDRSEDLFHAANNALFIMGVNLELLTRHFRITNECEHLEPKKWIALLSEKAKEVGMVNRQLLSVASPEGEGPLYLIHSFISFRTVILRAVAIYEDIAVEKNVRITWQVPDFAAIAIWTDGLGVAVVLDNLLSNAIKYSEPGTTVDVSMRHEGDHLICTVRDEGPGLSEADQERLFERGVRLTPKPTGGESSSGYGLAIAHSVVETLGGRLWCESELGKGTSFMVSLPTALPASIEPQTSHDDEASASPEPEEDSH